MGNIDNIAIRPMLAFLGEDIAQQQRISCRPSTVAASLGGKYLLFQDAAGAKHYAWFDTGSSVDPAPAGGWTGHAVSITDPVTSTQVATALAAVLTAVSGFDATSSGAVVTLVHTAIGFANPARDPDGGLKTQFAFEVSILGATEVELGDLSGDIEIQGLKADEEDITAHATGTTVLGRLVKGYKPFDVVLTLEETTKAQIEAAFVASGHYPFLPVGSAATEVFGFGVTSVGRPVATTRLRLHPVQKGDADKVEDVTFWKVRANLDSLKYSGEKIQTIPLTLTVFLDSSKNKEIQFFMIGDPGQSGLGL